MTYEFYSYPSAGNEIFDIVYNPKSDKIIYNEYPKLNDKKAKKLISTINHEMFIQILNELKK